MLNEPCPTQYEQYCSGSKEGVADTRTERFQRYYIIQLQGREESYSIWTWTQQLG